MEKVKSVLFNWRQVGSVQDRDGAGEDYDKAEVVLEFLILIQCSIFLIWKSFNFSEKQIKNEYIRVHRL